VQQSLVILGIDTLLEESDSDENSQDGMEVDRQYSVSYEEWKQGSTEARSHMMTEGDQDNVTIARDRLLAFLNGLQLVGLGGDKAQKVFAGVMNIMMTEFVRAAYTGKWETPTSAAQHLRHWIENVFARLAVQVLAIIHTPPSGTQTSGSLDVSFGDVEKWQEIGIARLGALRTSELFDVIVEWPASTGAVEDLRYFTTHPAARAYVTQSFIGILNQRLLHPGASTVEILQLYISIIRAFHLLDPKGVLLDRIARPIRRYLRDRDDTVKVIVSGLLAEPPAADNQAIPTSGDTLVELSTELAKAHQLSIQSNTSDLDWDDMNWVPDPVDAAPDYRKSKSSDVIDSLISLFDSKETFVKELQALLSDRLLQKREDFDQEISVLELLKVRFGDSALQACEVMLKDISDSRRVDSSVRKDQGLSKPPSRMNTKRPTVHIPELHAKILSRFFWPEIQDQGFKVPDEIAYLQHRYSTGFESLKQSRKLTWRNGLGQVTVELELGDRTFVDEVSTWQATIIYAFQSDDDEPSTKAITDLASELDMAPALVRSACLFWVSKRILTEPTRDTFRVLEYLPAEAETQEVSTNMPDQSADTANAAAAAEAAAAVAAKETAEAAAMEKMNLYWQFIVGMLTNQGAMPLQRIVMMLKIVVPGGFPFSNEELREFLAGMVSKGKIEIVSGGNYKLIH
jgi:anaphase-promoting complex subunit 2